MARILTTLLEDDDERCINTSYPVGAMELRMADATGRPALPCTEGRLLVRDRWNFGG